MRFLSKKQVDQIDSSYVGFNNWLKKLGDAPVVIKESKTEKSVERLERWYSSLGYFNNEVSFKVEPDEKRKKRAALVYSVNRQKPYIVGDSIIEKISSPVVDSLFQRTKQYIYKTRQTICRCRFCK